MVAFFELLPIKIVGKIIDSIVVLSYKDSIEYVFLFAAALISNSVLSNLNGFLISDFNNSIIEEVRSDITSSTLYHDFRLTDRDNSGSLITVSTSDVEQITRAIAGPLNGFLKKILMFFFALAMICFISFWLGLIAITASALLYILSIRISTFNKKIAMVERKKIGEFSLRLYDVMRNLALIKTFKMEEREQSDLKLISDEVFLLRRKLLTAMAFYWICVALVDCLCYTLCFIFIISEIKNGNCTVSSILVMYSYLQMIFSSMINVSRYKTEIYNSDAAIQRVFEAIKKHKTTNQDIENHSICNDLQEVSVRDLSISFDGVAIVSKLCFSLKKGTISVLFAESGKGKSSIIHALSGLLSMDSGKVLFNGIDVTNDIPTRRNLIRTCFQRPYLFQRTLQENLNYGLNGETTNPTPFVETTYEILEKKGRKEVLDANNNGVSEGEAKRISLARTCNKDVPFFIFDEPTSGLDQKNRRIIVQELNELKKNHILLVATHDEDVCAIANQIIYI